ncbi:ABC transporter substrate-binding protein [Desulfitobacterium sp. THU1]|uniref:ABC transporter substrate-binding protein n=1 Tax=Desulfitobacterium sp. THU1 TaxID=3138072 RepID=UPI00311D95B8
MKRKAFISITLALFLVTFLAGCSQQGSSQGQSEQPPSAKNQVITDMAGRQVEVPTIINKVYSTSATGSVFLYTLSPQKLAGWNSKLRDDEKRFVATEYQNLPDLGRWKGTTPTGSIEELLKAAPDIIISVGDVSPEYIGEADEIQKQTGIPVLMIDGSLEYTAEAYRFLGNLIGESERAEQLATYCNKTLERIKANSQSLADAEKVPVYYAEGVEGLETEISGTVNSEAFDLSGANNVAVPATQDVRRMQVSIEQILKWNPEVIIISTDGDTTHALYENILKDKSWANLDAVKNGEVYEIPSAPYDWINRPPSVVRFIGVQWLSSLLYPELVQNDIRQDVNDFYSLFFNYDMSDSEIDELLATSMRK